jgi:hypothetical protein
MTKHEESNKEEASSSIPPTVEQALAGQADWVRAIVREEIAKWEKRQLHERRFGVPYPPKEVK